MGQQKERYAAMTDDRLRDLTALDEHIVDTLQKRVRIWHELEESGYEFSQQDNQQLVSNWLEVAADYDLEEELIEKVAKICNALCRRAEE
jgi:hypothetical protein